MSISRIFDLSRRSMATYQRALDITAHNIANTSNPDYSRQRVTFTTEPPEISGGFVWGTGIKLDTIQRVRNHLTDAQLRANYQILSMNNKKSELLSQIEGLYTEPTELGLANLMSSFFNSWQELAVTPNSSVLRSNVIHSAQKISSKVEGINDGLKTAKGNLLTDMNADVNRLNNYLNQVQQLNKQIIESENIGNNAADLFDRRDKVLDELNRLVNVNVTFDDKKSAIVSIGGIFAADSSTAMKFSLIDNNGKMALVSEKGGAIANLTNGELAALADVYSDYIPSYLANLDSLMSSMVDAVNAEHSKGYSTHTPAKTGINFFQDYSDGKLIISEDILLDPRNIAVSEDGSNGNGNIAVAIGELADKQLLNGLTLSESYISFIGEMGNDVLSANQQASSSDLLVQQLENQRASTSGVSIDEEMANVLKFQKSYEASARLIKVANDLLDTLLNLV